MKLTRDVLIFGSALLALSATSTAAPTDEVKDESVVITSKMDPSDRQVRAEVQTRINERPSLRFFNIVVYSSNREVYLEGLVDTMMDRDLADVIAGSVPGVRRVHNELAMNGS